MVQVAEFLSRTIRTTNSFLPVADRVILSIV